MEAVQWFSMVGAFLGGAAIGAAACYWPLNRSNVALREHLARAEQARNGAVERSAQAREQIAQLNKAIADMRKSHAFRTGADDRRERAARAEEALRQANPAGPVIAGPLKAFADTQTLER
jgi:hypothetical protein